jgi:hypothetical protein
MDAALDGAVCANIGPKERRLRNQVGVIGVAITLLLIGALLETHVPRVWRLTVFFPAFLSAMGFLQARAQTCVRFAREGIRVLSDNRDNAEKVIEPTMAAKIASQARRVYLQSVAAVVGLILLVLVIP